MPEVAQSELKPLPLVWGSRAIADALGLSKTSAEYMLSKGTIAGARKVGGKWSLNTQEFMAQYKGKAA